MRWRRLSCLGQLSRGRRRRRRVMRACLLRKHPWARRPALPPFLGAFNPGLHCHPLNSVTLEALAPGPGCHDKRLARVPCRPCSLLGWPPALLLANPLGDTLQVLEAMASGLPVVATATGGVTSFATPSVDCLLAPPGRHAELAQHVLSVLGDAALAARLAAAARNTAGAYTAERVVGQLERALYCLTACRQELLALRLQALPDAQLAAGAAVKACSGAVAAHKAALRARQRAASAATAGVVSALAVTSEAEQRHRKGKACECCTVLPPAQANGAATAERTSQDEQQVPEQQQEQHALDNPARQQQREQQQQVPHNECRPAAEQAGAAPETRQHPLQRRRYSGDAKRQRRSLDTPPQSPTAKEAEGEGGKSEALYTLRSARQL